MPRLFLAYTGMATLCFSVTLGVIFLHGYQKAIQLDVDSGGAFLAPPCFYPLQDAQLERKVMSVKESQVLTVTLAAPSLTECETTVRVQAPKFDLGAGTSERKITVPPRLQEVKVIWVISPTDVGTYAVVVAAGPWDLGARQLGVTVTNVLGLSARWAQVAMYIAGVLGPILTVPWWYEKLKHRKTKADDDDSPITNGNDDS